MTTIDLNRSWKLGGELASGGFAKVYEAEADDGSAAVVKLIPKDPGAQRELLFEDISSGDNIIPVLDTGEWQDNWVLVMPRADKSLRQHMADSGGQLPLDQAMPILVDITEALASIAGDVVHRDLKPENVLLYEGRWCLADFGIARYAEATTELDTRKFAMTAPYAAPEQWRGERAQSATDMYAFGVIAFELTQGHRPFAGPDYREEHLNDAPPALTGCSPALASLVTECLYKIAAARPTPTNILTRLIAAPVAPSPSVARLQEVQKVVAEKRAQETAQLSAEQARNEAREELYTLARNLFQDIAGMLCERVEQIAPATNVVLGGLAHRLQLNDGSLAIDPVQLAPADCLENEALEPPFDVIAYSAIEATKPVDSYGYEGRQHSLWYCDAHDEGVYRWYELGFMLTISGQSFKNVPDAFKPTSANARMALSSVNDVSQVAWDAVPFDQGEEEQFVERWIGWFASAADGTLSSPPRLPENSGGRHRQGRVRAT